MIRIPKGWQRVTGGTIGYGFRYWTAHGWRSDWCLCSKVEDFVCVIRKK